MIKIANFNHFGKKIATTDYFAPPEDDIILHLKQLNISISTFSSIPADHIHTICENLEPFRLFWPLVSSLEGDEGSNLLGNMAIIVSESWEFHGQKLTMGWWK